MNEQAKNAQKELPTLWISLIVEAFTAIEAQNEAEKVKNLRLETLGELYRQLKAFQQLGYADFLLEGIAKKKTAFILEAKTKSDAELLKHPRAPHFDGAKFVPGKYYIPEEELIGWCETSLKAPLNSTGFQRYMSVFRELYPDIDINPRS